MKEFNLSECICEELAIKVFKDNRDVQWIKVPDVKEFIKIAEDLLKDLEFRKITWSEFADKWVNLLGDKLI